MVTMNYFWWCLYSKYYRLRYLFFCVSFLCLCFVLSTRPSFMGQVSCPDTISVRYGRSIDCDLESTLPENFSVVGVTMYPVPRDVLSNSYVLWTHFPERDPSNFLWGVGEIRRSRKGGWSVRRWRPGRS